MQYPKELATAVQQASRSYPLEGFVPGQGPLQPKLMIVGEAPGRTEIENFIPFSGQAGKELMKSLALAGLTREDVYITSAVRSRPYSVKERINKRSGAHEIVHPNRTPTKRKSCYTHHCLTTSCPSWIRPSLQLLAISDYSDY